MTDGPVAPGPAPVDAPAAVAASDLIVDAFQTVRVLVDETVERLSPHQLGFRPSPTSNSIAWLIWHLTRVQDDHLAGAMGQEQLWMSGWRDTFALPFDDGATGHGQDPHEVAAVWVESGSLLTDYHHVVSERTIRLVAPLSPRDLARVVDDRRDLPVTLGVRLMSVVKDDLQHVGQAAFVRGLLDHVHG